ncbi:hypothetical protein FRB93_001419 [Tulasnella sp. JGI-2019a]|nr:hypothetical protein FRB93_001419 [Tulasnella sp. JGI-2019a]
MFIVLPKSASPPGEVEVMGMRICGGSVLPPPPPKQALFFLFIEEWRVNSREDD